jgi:hypothetical protein
MRRLATIVLAAAAPLAAGCSALERTQGVTTFAPDTQAQVIAAQAVNPWPRKAYDKTWPTDGARAAARWRWLRNGGAVAAEGGGAPVDAGGSATTSN